MGVENKVHGTIIGKAKYQAICGVLSKKEQHAYIEHTKDSLSGSAARQGGAD